MQEDRGRAPSRLAVHVRDVVKTFDRGRTRALDGVDLDVEVGEFVAVAGPSASGKSTLLHLIAALDRPDSGRIVVAGVDLGSRVDRDRYRAETVGIVFQMDHLLPVLTAHENVEAALIGSGLPSRERRARVAGTLDAVGLADVSARRPPTLSGGQRQRLAIARALAMRPAILLADEPTGRLDQATGRHVIELIATLRWEYGLTVILVTHDASIAATADRTVAMVDGRFLAPGSSCPACSSWRARAAVFCGACGRDLAGR